MNNPICKVSHCSFPHTHSTISHRCGTCNSHGHGQIECGNIRKIHELKRFHGEELPDMNDWCTIDGCSWKKFHTNESHHCLNCSERGTHSSRNCRMRPVNSRLFNRMNDGFTVPEPEPAAVDVTVPTLITKKCPQCRVDSEIDINHLIFTGAPCCCCFDTKKMIIFKECGHAQVCFECVKSII